MSIASSSRLVVRSVLFTSRRQITRLAPATRSYASEAAFDPSQVERATDEVDVCIVGGGPAGLSAAIRIKQLEKERGGDAEELRVVVLEKGAEVGTSNNSHRGGS
jgi:electron-transferring-flavoprotein dehydrogenase